MKKHKVRQVGPNLYECTACGEETEGWLPMTPSCPGKTGAK